MNYTEALDYIYSYAHPDRPAQPKWTMDEQQLQRVAALLDSLGNPHRSFNSVLIAGTKGKGSTSAFTESMLRAAGHDTGLYISPHLHTFRERIRIRGEYISEAKVAELVERLRPQFEAVPDLTAFELMTSLAFVAYAEAGVRVAVLEVGLGGRLDATNVVDPAVAVITSISYDHMNVLGDTLTLIAREKAGIIRPGALVVSAPQVPEAMTMIEEVCEGRRAELIVVGEEEYRWQPGHISLRGQSFEVGGQSYWIPLLGLHQLVNATNALAAVDALERRSGIRVPVAARRQGLRDTEWPGRLEVLSRRPYLVVDSAHNGDSALKLRLALAEIFPGRRATLVFGASHDHPFGESLQQLLPAARRVILTRSQHPRATPPETLAQAAAGLGFAAETAPTVREALALALDGADKEALICVTGSIFTVAEARVEWFVRAGLPLPPMDPPV